MSLALNNWALKYNYLTRQRQYIYPHNIFLIFSHEKHEEPLQCLKVSKNNAQQELNFVKVFSFIHVTSFSQFQVFIPLYF